jgi:tetratricopeptide (TPR) repeat protein
MLLLLAGCATPRSSLLSPPSSLSVLPVPFIAQQPNRCGPSALAMVAGYHGTNITQEAIAAALPPAGKGGALTIDLVQGARQLGFWARHYRGDLADLRAKLTAGIPLIVRGCFGNNEHFFVVIGYDPHRQIVTVHTDQRPNHELRAEDFARFWDRGGRWTLVACPPARATWKLSADEHNDLAVFLEQQGQLVAAAGHFREAATSAGSNSYYFMNLGNVLAKQKLFAEAVTAYRQAVTLDPQNADALNNLAWALGETGANLDEAVQLCQRAIELAPPHRAYYLDTLGGVLLRQGDRPRAFTAFEQALAATTDRQESLRRTIRQHLESAR